MRWDGTTPPTRQPAWRTYLRIFSGVVVYGHWRQAIKRHRGSPVFLVVSHHHISRDYMINAIRKTYGAKAVCFIHDLIPIDYPEYCGPGSEAHHRRRIDNVARNFDAAIVNSETTADSLRTYLREHPDLSASRLDIRTAFLGVRAFRVPNGAAVAPSNRPYFVMLATIEPKKNHLMILNLWARLATTMNTPPQLKVIGARGWDNEQIVDMLERSRRLRGLVFECGLLDQEEVGREFKDARAILVPSLVEGFGLPLAEALASGIPAICSDIPAFREIGRDVPEYLDPLDLFGWMNIVQEYSRPDSPQRAAQVQRLANWRAPTWEDHFKTVGRLLEDLDTC